MNALITLFLISVFILAEWLGRKDKYALEKIIFKFNATARILIYYLLMILIFWFTNGDNQKFIYFQF